MRETQREKCYRWEREALRSEEKLTLEECKQLVIKAWKWYFPNSIIPPSVRDGRGRRSACYDGNNHVIQLPKWGRLSEVALHEAAHAIIDRLQNEAKIARTCGDYRNRYAHHGKEFVAVFINLLKRFDAYESKADLKASALSYGVRCASLRDFMPQKRVKPVRSIFGKCADWKTAVADQSQMLRKIAVQSHSFIEFADLLTHKKEQDDGN